MSKTDVLFCSLPLRSMKFQFFQKRVLSIISSTHLSSLGECILCMLLLGKQSKKIYISFYIFRKKPYNNPINSWDFPVMPYFWKEIVPHMKSYILSKDKGKDMVKRNKGTSYTFYKNSEYFQRSRKGLGTMVTERWHFLRITLKSQMTTGRHINDQLLMTGYTHVCGGVELD